MKANVKGFNFEVTINGKIACANWDETNTRKDIDRDRSNTTKGEGLDIDFNVGIKTGAEEYQGEIDLHELVESIKTIVDSSIEDQIKSQLDNCREDMKKDIGKDIKEDMYKELNDRDKSITDHVDYTINKKFDTMTMNKE